MVSISGTISKGWLAKELGAAFDRDYYFNPERRYEIDSRCNEYVLKKFGDIGVFYSESNMGRLEYWSKEQAIVGGIQPNMILGMLLGADFVPNKNADGDISGYCLRGKNICDLGEPESLLEHELIVLFDEQIHKINHSGDKELRAIPPFFWDVSGRAFIHGVMTTAQKFIGENIFMDMLTKPAESMSLMEWIAEAYVVLCKHFSQVGNMGISEIHIGECSSCMISKELFEQFVVPITSKIGSLLGPVRLHSCGSSTHLIEACHNIANLRTLDVGGETSVAKIREVFVKDFPVSIAPMAEDFCADKPDEIVKWAGKVLDDNDNGELKIIYHLESDYNIDNLWALYEQI